ncbi:MAG: hypothetical protein KatS3mg105_0940 [Gemmatales bacterium]|nr:MAG: hypothetical protein KatS3mg105_0940 [Gemmatales bacterium]
MVVPIYDEDKRWFGPMLSSFGILSNLDVLKRIDQPAPTSWSDLGRDGMFSWVSAGDPRQSGSVHMVYEIILQARGWDEGFRLLMRLGANTRSFIRDSGTLTRSVTNGDVAAAGNIDVQALSAVGRYPTMMHFHLPAGETIINADAIARLKGAPHSELGASVYRIHFERCGTTPLLFTAWLAGWAETLSAVPSERFQGALRPVSTE